MDKAIATKMIHEIAVVWNDRLVSKRFLLVYGKGPYEYKEIVILKRQLLHLTGAQTDLSAEQFFDKAANNTLSHKQYTISPANYEEKLSALYRCPDFICSASKIGASSGVAFLAEFAFALGPHPVVEFICPNGRACIPISFQKRPLYTVAKDIKDIKAIFCRPIKERGPFEESCLIMRRRGLDEELLDPAKVRLLAK